MTRSLRLTALTWALGLACSAHAQVSPQGCGTLSNGENGPFDYRIERGRRLAVVEEFHFNAKVESLISGQTGAIAQDLDYVLRAFPNHHRALLAMGRLARRSNSVIAPHAPLPAECYFERALRFKPDDQTARMLYATFLHEMKRPEEAIQQLDVVIKLAPDAGFTQYNVGMVFAEMGMYDRALAQAHLARKLGFVRPDLQQRLEQAGHWREPPTAEAAPPGPAASTFSPF